MRASRRQPKLETMIHARRQAVTLELSFDGSDVITGRMVDSVGRCTDFVGWLGLAGAIELLSEEPPGQAPVVPPGQE